MKNLAYLSLALFATVSASPAFSQEDLTKDIADIADRGEMPSYVFEGKSGNDLPVVSISKDGVQEVLEQSKENTISFVYMKKDFHGLIRVGDVLFDVLSVNTAVPAGRDVRNEYWMPKGRSRSYSGVMKHSKNTLWIEAVMKANPEDIALIQQFFFYREAIYNATEQTLLRGQDVSHPWFKEFYHIGEPPFDRYENCSGYVQSPFNKEIVENPPPQNEWRQIDRAAKKIAKKIDRKIKFLPPAEFFEKIKELPGRYNFEQVSAPPGLMRIAYHTDRAQAFLVHNSKHKDQATFRSKNSMNFGARYPKEDRLTDGSVDAKVGGRTLLSESALLGGSCSENLGRAVGG